MDTYKLLIHGSPVRAGQKIYLIHKEQIVREIVTGCDNLMTYIQEILSNQVVTKIQLAGSKTYMKKIEQEIKKQAIVKNANHTIVFEYI